MMRELKRLPGRRFDRFFRLFRRVIGFKPDKAGDGSGFKSEGFGERDFIRTPHFAHLFDYKFFFSKRNFNAGRIFKHSPTYEMERVARPFNYPRALRKFFKFINLKSCFDDGLPSFYTIDCLKYLRFTGRNKGIFFRSGKSNRGQEGKEQSYCNNLFHLIHSITRKFGFVKEMNV